MDAPWLSLPAFHPLQPSQCSGRRNTPYLQGQECIHTAPLNPPVLPRAGNVSLSAQGCSAEHLEYSLLPLLDLLQARSWQFFRYVCLEWQHKMLLIPPACSDTGHSCLSVMWSEASHCQTSVFTWGHCTTVLPLLFFTKNNKCIFTEGKRENSSARAIPTSIDFSLSL